MRPQVACRICNKRTLVGVLDLGNQAVSDFVATKRKPILAPLKLVICDGRAGGCGLVQLANQGVGRDILYRNYWYRSGINESMRQSLAAVTASITKLIPFQRGDIVVDIGANDGTLLGTYQTPGIVRVAFEPAGNLITAAKKNCELAVNDYFSASRWSRAVGSAQKAKAITTVAMFYDLNDPNRFVSDLRQTLAKDGLWVNEMTYFPEMLTKRAFDTICHEHIEYYTLKPFLKLLKTHALEVVGTLATPVNGGSLRTYVTHWKNLTYQRFGLKTVKTLLQREKDLELDTPQPYLRFKNEIDSLKNKLNGFIKREVSAGKKVAVYGASTKGNTMLQYFELDHKLISFAADRSPYKWGKQTVATNIPIVSEVEARQMKPDYFFVLPWHFRDVFIHRERPYLLAGGRMIFPIPQPEIVHMHSGKLITHKI